MAYYETMYIVHPALEAGRLKDLIMGVEDSLKKMGGDSLAVELWGKRKLAYFIDKQKYGTYILCQYAMGGEYVKEVSQELELNPNILRYLITKIESSVEKSPSDLKILSEISTRYGNRNVNELEFKTPEDFKKYKAKHKMRPGTVVKVAGKDKVVGDEPKKAKRKNVPLDFQMANEK